MTSTIRAEFLRFVADDSGQDIIEYALLTALIGVSSIAAWQVLTNNVGLAYRAADTDIQALAPPRDCTCT